MSKKHVDLRCSRRITVTEARLILDCLDFAKANAKGLRAKLAAAVTPLSVSVNRLIASRMLTNPATARREGK